MFFTIVIVAGLAIAVILAIHSIRKQKNSGCCGGGSACSGCSHNCHKED